jgi:hypothetical protein
MLWELAYNVKGCSRFSTGKNSLWRKIIQQTPLYTTAWSKSQLMKFLWGPILAPPNKIVDSDTYSLVPTPIPIKLLEKFLFHPWSLSGPDSTGDKVLRIGFWVVGIVHKNCSFRLVEGVELVSWSESSHKGRFFETCFVFMCSQKVTLKVI